MSHSDTTPRTFTADRMSAAFNEAGGQARPDYLPDIVAQAGRTRQRPAWTFLERWLPMDIAVRRQGVPRAVLVFAVLALLMTLLVATVAFIGSRSAPPPLAAATNGLIAFASDSDIVVVETDGSDRRTLISAPSELGGMAYSPDGRRLAYWSRALSGTWDLTVVDTDGGNPVTVASGITEQPRLVPPGPLTVPASLTPPARNRPRDHRANGGKATSARRASSPPRPMDPARSRLVTPTWTRGVPTGRRTAQRSPLAVAMHRRRSACIST